MKRLLSLLFLLTAFLAFPHFIFAQNNFQSGQNVNLSSSEIINQDYFAGGKAVTVDGTINGDAYLAGGDVTFNGVVNGDLLAAGGNININGSVSGNVRAAGGNININGKVGRNVSLAGGNILLTSNAKVNGSFTVAGGNFNLMGPIGKNLNAAGGNIQIANPVGGDVNALVKQIMVSNNARIGGNLTYWSSSKAIINSGSIISGSVTQRTPPRMQKNFTPPPMLRRPGPQSLLPLKIISFLSSLIIGLLLLKMVPNYTNRVSQQIRSKWLLNLAIGFLVLAITPVLLILLLITILGFPIAVIWIFGVILGLWIAKIFVSLAIGIYLSDYFKLKWSQYTVFSLGLIIYYLIASVPILGWLFTFVTVLIGLGAVFITKRNYYLELSKKKII